MSDRNENNTARTEDDSIVDEIKLLQKLENEGYDKLKKIAKNEQFIDAVNNPFMNIINEGAKEFKEKTGRQMTYAEMRAAYG
jgi:hypothetical protein